jgi:hypothetical protein
MKREIAKVGRKSKRSSVAVGKPPESVNDADTPNSSAAKAGERSLPIDVVWSDIKNVKADVFLVGHYLGVLPQTVELELDRLVSGCTNDSGGKLIITELTRRGALRGDLGELILFPGPNGRVVALGGMGGLGTFRAPQVGVLARAVAQGVGLLPSHRVLATVLIGSGKGNLRVREAVTGFLSGLIDALDADRELKLDRLMFIEMHLDRALEILAAVKESAQELNDQREAKGGVQLNVVPALVEGTGGRIPVDFGCAMMLAALAGASEESTPTDIGSALNSALAELPENLRDAVRTRLRDLHREGSPDGTRALREVAMSFRLREPENDSASDDIPSRVAFWCNENDIRAAAITNTTTVTQREILGRALLVQQGSDRLQRPTPEEFQEYAPKLCRRLIPTELKDVLKRSEPLVIEVDRMLARVQWEMLPAGLNGDPLGIARPISRQLRTFYSPRPFEPHARQKFRALLIGDPSSQNPSDPFFEQACKEIRQVAEVLENNRVEYDMRLGAPEAGTGAGVVQGVRPADYFDVIDLLLSGEYDIVHYSGHAKLEPKAGWVFESNLLTADELEGMEQPPSLVVANACLSSQVSQHEAKARSEASVQAASKSRGDPALVVTLADEFFKQGVSDYVGAAWEIPSIPATEFAKEFYTALLTKRIGVAICQARKALYTKRDKWGTAWAAYQHYGDPTRSINFRFALTKTE